MVSTNEDGFSQVLAKTTPCERFFIGVDGSETWSAAGAIGLPQFGHSTALSDTCPPHSPHSINATTTLSSSSSGVASFDTR